MWIFRPKLRSVGNAESQIDNEATKNSGLWFSIVFLLIALLSMFIYYQVKLDLFTSINLDRKQLTVLNIDDPKIAFKQKPRSPEAKKPRVNTQDNAKPNPIVLENEEKIVENENSKANANATKKLTARTDPSHLQIFVLTRRDSFDLRKAITDSWAKPFKNNVTFMVGDYCPNPPHTRETWVCRLKPGSEMGEDFHTEQETYQNNEQLLNQKIFNETSNTALLDFYDTYRNLTLKVKVPVRISGLVHETIYSGVFCNFE